jgi:ATP-binding cassette, subfamily B, bacterial
MLRPFAALMSAIGRRPHTLTLTTPYPTGRPFGPFNRLRRIFHFVLPFRKAVILLSGVTLLVAAFNAAEPLVLKYIFDELSSSRQLTALGFGVAVLAILGLLREGASAGAQWLTWRTRLGIHYRLLEAMVERLHRLPLAYHRSTGVGAIMTKLDRGIQGFLSALTELLFNTFPAVLYLGISIFVMFNLNATLAAVVICFAPIPAIVAAFASPDQTRRERKLLDHWVRIYSRFNEVLSGILTVRSFSMEEREKQRFLTDVASANGLVVGGVRRDAKFVAAGNLVVLIARITAISVASVLLINGQITLGTVMAFLGYVSGLFGPVQGLSNIYQTVRRASVSLEEISSILDVNDHLADRVNARSIESVQGRVTFRNVHFGYECEGPVLRGIDIDAQVGETVAIVGPSGSGKTTLVALLMRFYDPSQGSVCLDGVDIRDLKQDDLRRHIGVVLQEPLLFNDTVRNNIAYGRPESTQAEIVAAAKAANAHDFISALSDGYDTIIGERGGRLSVGERQRLTIARALVKDPRLIVLDEATASLDAESEAVVQDALERLMHGRTTFVIAHRLATVVNATKIIVLKEGHIAEQGSHRELMVLNGYYASLVRRQTRGLILNGAEWSHTTEAAPERKLSSVLD